MVAHAAHLITWELHITYFSRHLLWELTQKYQHILNPQNFDVVQNCSHAYLIFFCVYNNNNNKIVWCVLFVIREDMYAQDSIELLTTSGIQFKKHEDEGIETLYFAELLMTSGVVLCDGVKWLSFHRYLAFFSMHSVMFEFWLALTSCTEDSCRAEIIFALL